MCSRQQSSLKGGKGDPSTLFCHLTNQHAFMSQTLLEAEREVTEALKNRVLNGIVSSCRVSQQTVTAARPGQPQEFNQQKIN